jgi:hypothetical protein
MIDGNAKDFIEKLYYEDHYVIFDNNKYFFNGCQTRKDSDGKIISVKLEVYNISTNETIFSAIKASASECVEAFEDSAIWNGKSFWEVETDMTWVDE